MPSRSARVPTASARQTLTRFQRRGIPREELKSRLKLTSRVFNAVVNKLVREQMLVERAAFLAKPAHLVEFVGDERLPDSRFCKMTEFATNLKEQRLLRRGMTVERAAAVLAAHIDVVNWQNLVERHGFTTREFEAWLVDVTAAAILRP